MSGWLNIVRGARASEGWDLREKRSKNFVYWRTVSSNFMLLSGQIPKREVVKSPSILFLLLVGGSSAASAQTLECERLKTTQIPFEVTGESVLHPGFVYKSQIYRDKSGPMTIYTAGFGRQRDGQLKRVPGISKNIVIGRFPIEQEPSGDLKVNFEYKDVNPETFDYEAKSHRFMSIASDNKGSYKKFSDTTYQFLEKAYFDVGPCRFEILKSRSDAKQTSDDPKDTESALLKSEMSYSLELRTNLERFAGVYIGQKSFEMREVVKEIKTDFAPFQ